jgi:hypothetical protein
VAPAVATTGTPRTKSDEAHTSTYRCAQFISRWPPLPGTSTKNNKERLWWVRKTKGVTTTAATSWRPAKYSSVPRVARPAWTPRSSQ